MAKRSASVTDVVLTATADATNLVDASYPLALTGATGGAATARYNVIEVYCGGQSASSAVALMLFSRDSTIAATAGANAKYNDAPLDASTAALAQPIVGQNTWTTKPQRSTTAHLLNLTFNAFGGIVRWVAAPGEEITCIGFTASLGGVDLSCFTGGSGTIGAHVIYEPF